jgi:hypothetical protein
VRAIHRLVHDHALRLLNSIPRRAEARFGAFRRMDVSELTVHTFARIHISDTPTAPVIGVNTRLDPAMKRRMRPLCHRGNMTMFDRIVMNIVQVARVIRVVTHGVFPDLS